jgi:HTH-type transcriptional regulator, cell division transcriptional repressor
MLFINLWLFIKICASMKRKHSSHKLVALRLGEELAKQRRKRGLTQAQLAELVDLEPISVSRIETGSVLPSIVRLQDLAGALGVSAARLIGVSDVSSAAHAREIEELLDPLNPNDRSLLIGIVKHLAHRLRG